MRLPVKSHDESKPVFVMPYDTYEFSLYSSVSSSLGSPRMVLLQPLRFHCLLVFRSFLLLFVRHHLHPILRRPQSLRYRSRLTIHLKEQTHVVHRHEPHLCLCLHVHNMLQACHFTTWAGRTYSFSLSITGMSSAISEGVVPIAIGSAISPSS